MQAYGGCPDQPMKFNPQVGVSPHLSSGVGTVTLEFLGPTTLAAMEQFLQALLWDMAYPKTKIFRLKGKSFEWNTIFALMTILYQPSFNVC